MSIASEYARLRADLKDNKEAAQKAENRARDDAPRCEIRSSLPGAHPFCARLNEKGEFTLDGSYALPPSEAMKLALWILNTFNDVK